MKLNILVVDDHSGIRETIKLLLEDKHNVFEAADGASMFSILAKSHMDVILLDIRLERISGIDLILKIREIEPDAIIIMISVENGHEAIIKCLRFGVFDYLVKPFGKAELAASIERAQSQITMRNAYHYNSWAGTKDADEYPMIGDSSPIQDLSLKIQQSAKARQILITGETGVGKELVARAIHRRGPRSENPFVAVNCGAIPVTLFESEFFGYEPGAFTGADSEKKGMFEIANGGTLFLDEIGELSTDSQVKLLRVIESGCYSRLGGTRLLHADVIIYAATNKDLKKQISEGKFREDLFYRLSAIEIHVPPLLDRRDDIPVLIGHFIEKHCRRLHVPRKSMESEAVNYLRNHSEWPGNVRELENLIIRLLTFAAKETISLDEVRLSLAIPAQQSNLDGVIGRIVGEIPLEDIARGRKELQYQVEVMIDRGLAARIQAQYPGSVRNISRILGVSRKILEKILRHADQPGEAPPN